MSRNRDAIMRLMRRLLAPFCFTLMNLLLLVPLPIQAQDTAPVTHVIEPGDTWAALAFRYDLEPATLRQLFPHINSQRAPVIGDTLQLPAGVTSHNGRFLRTNDGGLLQTAVRYNVSPWTLALRHTMPHPYRPLLYQPLFIPGGEQPPRELPSGFVSLELSPVPARPGQALGVRGQSDAGEPVTAMLAGAGPLVVAQNGRFRVGLIGAGAFFGAGAPALAIQVGDEPLWAQPWRFAEGQWTFQQITLTGAAAEIDQEAIAAERERLVQLWAPVTPQPLWAGPFRTPIERYLEISSAYGARRSYNGGPYRTYHEGVDFSAYGGTAVYAPAAGRVVLAETLYVRGGAVIIDHGLGIYTGYYHLSEVVATLGQWVQPGTHIGNVGTTGLSTGNHLHWDLLVGGTWVDAAAWQEQGMGCWVLAAWGQGCGN